jgi:hypothetical protein
MNAIVRLRIIQVGCILMVLGCIWVSRSGHHEWQGSLAPRHWLVMVAAIWGAISGFTLQRRLVGQPVNSRRPSRSTPFTRWRAGHIVRIWTAMTVGLGALLLSEFSGPPMMVNVLFALSLLLLLIWTPGPIPDQTKQA